MQKNVVKWVLFGFIIILLFAFRIENDATQLSVANNINNFHKNNLNIFYKSIQTLENKENQNLSENALKPYFLACREQFKHCEFLLTYVNLYKNLKYNGPNVPYVVFDGADVKNIEQPHGLQVMEDLIYNANASSRSALKTEILALDALVKKEINRIADKEVYDARTYNNTILDAVRMELIRIETLGITGFDVPDSKNAIPEAIEALKTLAAIIQFYKPLFDEANATVFYNKANPLFNNAINYLKNDQDFEALNRLELMTDYLQPLSAWVSESFAVLHYDYLKIHPASNPQAKHLFAEDFLTDPYYADANEYTIALGKKLFYETLLSKNRQRSCASCHIPQLGFADGLAKNVSLDGSQFLPRNTPTLINAAYQRKFLYDSKFNTIEKQSMNVIHNEMEMNGNLELVVDTLFCIPEYVDLYEKGFNGILNEYTTIRAITDYVTSLKSVDSRFDKYMNGDKEALTPSEINGFNLFAGKAKCATCHYMPMFNGLVPPFYMETESEIIGVPASTKIPYELDADLGKYEINKLDFQKFSFKTTTLKNIELTAPYMHNGIFNTLEEVVDFYNDGGGVGHGIDLPSQTLPTDSLHLTTQEKADLVLFMKALTDEAYR
ncbi:MAG: cytochrome C peroxidase [Bacteroidetes bacterium]|nr:cytochrome C peroxidase [Bacteroidota bacterium]MCB9225703.1 cytochrome C peroxidase [Chitinophagales bacterium]